MNPFLAAVHLIASSSSLFSLQDSHFLNKVSSTDHFKFFTSAVTKQSRNISGSLWSRPTKISVWLIRFVRLTVMKASQPQLIFLLKQDNASTKAQSYITRPDFTTNSLNIAKPLYDTLLFAFS